MSMVGLVQDCSNSGVIAMELLQSCTMALMCAVTPLLTHWSYCSHALSHRCVHHQANCTSKAMFWENDCPEEVTHAWNIRPTHHANSDRRCDDHKIIILFLTLSSKSAIKPCYNQLTTSSFKIRACMNNCIFQFPMAYNYSSMPSKQSFKP